MPFCTAAKHMPADIACSIHIVLQGQGSGNFPERDSRLRRSLRLQQRVTGAMHRHTLELSIDRGKQADNLDFHSLTEHVKSPRTVFAAAPGEKDLLFQE